MAPTIPASSPQPAALCAVPANAVRANRSPTNSFQDTPTALATLSIIGRSTTVIGCPSSVPSLVLTNSGARLGVFLAIALHSNADGWAWPSIAVLKAETGYNVQTISQALRDLCMLTIDDQRVLLAVQDHATTGMFATNRYLLFPSDEDVARYAGEGDDPQAAPPLDAARTAAPSGALS